ncbi:YceI family protein [Pseudophaeobacter sp.]|uniref:YceI family protein n=1 Tax=Pseudophaeobacter sp. TaxID=1971739 RepID=UPI003299D0D7
MLSRRQTLLGLISLVGSTGLATAASPSQSLGYVLDLASTKVKFGFQLNGFWQNGTMPILRSQIALNPKRLATTRVSVSLDASAAKTGLIFATRAMTSPEVLNVEKFPTISFATRRVLLSAEGRLSNGAEMIGDLTLRGVTRPLSLAVALYRRPGSAVDDLSRLDFTLRGSLSRAAFGASGYAGLVGDRVRLDIHASLRQVT